MEVTVTFYHDDEINSDRLREFLANRELYPKKMIPSPASDRTVVVTFDKSNIQCPLSLLSRKCLEDGFERIMVKRKQGRCVCDRVKTDFKIKPCMKGVFDINGINK